MTGRASGGQPLQVVFDLTARGGDGVLIPCTPAAVLAIKLAKGEIRQWGAMPCCGLLDLADILGELRPLQIAWQVSRSG